MTLKDSTAAISSPGSPDGISPCSSPDGETGQSGQEAVHVSRFRAQDNERAMPTNDTSGPLFTASSPSADLQLSLANRLQARMDVNGSPLYALTWGIWDMPAGVPICRLRASGRRTSDSDCGGWPTPNSRENGGGDYTDPNKALKRKEHRHQLNLSEAALLAGWPSPMAGTPAQHGYNEAGEHGQREEDGRAGRGVAKPSNAEWRPGAGWQNGTQIGDCGGMGLPDGEGRDASGLENFAGPVEVDETYFGGREANNHAKKKKRLGRGGVGKAVIAGAKDRATKPRERQGRRRYRCQDATAVCSRPRGTERDRCHRRR